MCALQQPKRYPAKYIYLYTCEYYGTARSKGSFEGFDQHQKLSWLECLNNAQCTKGFYTTNEIPDECRSYISGAKKKKKIFCTVKLEHFTRCKHARTFVCLCRHTKVRALQGETVAPWQSGFEMQTMQGARVNQKKKKKYSLLSNFGSERCDIIRVVLWLCL